MSCQQVPTAPAFNPYPRSVQVGEFEVAIGGGIWVAIGATTTMKTKNIQLRSHINERSAQLRHIAAELKTELFGIDDIIDRLIDTIRAWYVLPDIINRPVIVNLWGLTGTGKTQLIRSLSKKLGFYDRLIARQGFLACMCISSCL